MGMFRVTISLRMGFAHGTPGLATTRSNSPSGAFSAPNLTVTPFSRNRSASRRNASVSARSTPTTFAPTRASNSAAATPLTPNPSTSTLLFPNRAISEPQLEDQRSTDLQRAQRHQSAQDAKDVKAHDDLRFVPAFFFKMMVQRRHQENPPAFAEAFFGIFKIGPLRHYRHGLGHKYSARDQEHQRLMDQHREDPQRAAQRQRTGVPHEHERRMTVEP